MAERRILKNIIIVSLVILFLSGCATAPYQPVSLPGIYHSVASGQTLYRIAKTYNVEVSEIMRLNRITDPTKIRVGERLFIPRARVSLPVEPYRPLSQPAVEKLIGPKYRASHWRYITLHHSATPEGDAECFDKNHRSRRMGGLFYHFVIGNGTRSGDGEIEVGWRWKEQKEVNRPRDIQICLVGNFNKQRVSPMQFDALVKLINALRKQYKIAPGNIRRHKDIAGRRPTECPGNKFPFTRLLRELKKIGAAGAAPPAD